MTPASKHQNLWFKTRFSMRASLNPYDLGADNRFCRVTRADVHGLGELMYSAYRGGVDSESESVEDARAEIEATLDGQYGEIIPSASLIAMDGDRTASAVLFVWFEKEKMPLMAYAMTHADYKGRGIATKLIKAGLNGLIEAGYSECCLVVSDGNEPARTIYQKLGFEDVKKIRLAKGSRLNDPILQNAVEKLIVELKCHTVVLYGSRARGYATDESDYDLVGFAKDGEEVCDTRQFQGKFIDSYAYPEKRGEDTEEFMRLRGGIILREENDFGTELLNRVESLYRAGPKGPGSEELKRRRIWVQKMVARIERADLESRYRRNWLLTDLLELYFVFRGKWYLGPKDAFHYLKESDPSSYALFDRALRSDAGIDCVRELGTKVLSDS